MRLLFAGSSSYWNDMPREVTKLVRGKLAGRPGVAVEPEMVGRSGSDIRLYLAPGLNRYEYGVKLIAYEGGQHMVAFVKDQELVQKIGATMHGCNRHPRMGDMYRRYFDEWAKIGGDTFAVFSSIGHYSNHGGWGLAEYDDSRPTDYPKLEATWEWARTHGPTVEAGDRPSRPRTP